jgi:hypothetical protein
MVASVARTPRPRTLQIPVLQLYQQLRAELESLAPSHPALNRMYDIHSCDVLDDAIAEVRAQRMAQPVQSEMVARLQTEYHGKQARYHRAWLAWKDNRRKAWQIEHSPFQIIMELLPPDWSERDFPEIDVRAGAGPR